MVDHILEVGIRINTLRVRLGRISQQDLGQIINGTRKTNTSSWETGLRPPPLEKIAMRLYPYGVNVEYVMGTSDQFCRDGYTEDQIRQNIKQALEQEPVSQKSSA